MSLKWNSLPFNKSKVYLTNILYGGCHIFVPVINANPLEVKKTREELQEFVMDQEWHFTKDIPPGGGEYA